MVTTVRRCSGTAWSVQDFSCPREEGCRVASAFGEPPARGSRDSVHAGRFRNEYRKPQLVEQLRHVVLVVADPDALEN